MKPELQVRVYAAADKPPLTIMDVAEVWIEGALYCIKAREERPWTTRAVTVIYRFPLCDIFMAVEEPAVPEA